MLAAWLIVRAEVRLRWRRLLVLAVLVGFVGAVVLALVAGARRTASSLDRFEADSRAAQLEIIAGAVDDAQVAEFAHSRGVAAVGVLQQLALALPPAGFLPTAGQLDDSFGTVVDRPRVVSGRRADQRAADELTIGEALARQLDIGVGDRLHFVSYSPADVTFFQSGGVRDPTGPPLEFRIVGIVRRPLDLGGRGAAGGVVVPTQAFVEKYQGQIGNFSGRVLRVRTERGAPDVPRVAAAARRILGDSPGFAFQTLGIEGASARDAIDVTTIGLWIAAGVAGLAGLVAIAIAVAREIAGTEIDQLTLRALGSRPRHRVLAAAAPATLVALVGGVLAVVAAGLASPVFPFGVAGDAEPRPGIRFDAVVLVAGFVVLFAIVSAIAAVVAWRSSGSRSTASPVRSSAVDRAVRGLRTRPAMGVGIRFALEPGARATATRAALAGTAFGVGVVIAIVLFASSLDRVASTPRLFGWGWDVVTTDAGAETDMGCRPGTTRLTQAKVVDRVAALCTMSVEIAGRPVNAAAVFPIEGHVGLPIADGRAPRNAHEVALGADTQDALGKRFGDKVRIEGGEGTAEYRIVGTAVLPSLGDPAPIADGATLTPAGLLRLGNGSGSQDGWYLVARVKSGVSVEHAVHALTSLANPLDLPYGPIVPTEIERVRQVDNLNLALASFVALVALAAVGYTLVTVTRRRRRDLATLKALGFTRRQVGTVVAWHAGIVAAVGCIIGLPVGIVAGRIVWSLVARGLGVSTSSASPVVPVGAVIAVAIVAAVVVAVVPARWAARMKPAVALRSE